jgi:hypothetical protein
MSAVLHQAVALGARGVQADTLVDNVRALGVLRRLHFELKLADNGRDVRGLLISARNCPTTRPADRSANEDPVSASRS